MNILFKSIIVKVMDWMLVISILLAMFVASQVGGLVAVLLTFLASVAISCFWFAVSLICSRIEETNKLLAEISGKITKKLHEQ